MKRKILFLAVFFSLFTFSQSYGQGLPIEDQLAQLRYGGQGGKRISINVQEKSLRDLLKFIGGKAGVNILVDPEIQEKITIRLINVYWKNALKVITEKAKCVVEQISPNLYRVTKPPTVNMEFMNADIRVVLDFLAKQANSNIIISQAIQGKVNLSLKDVHWRQALETIVKTSGYVAVEEEGNIIRIVTRNSLKDQLETEILTLKYVRPPSTYRAAITSAGASTKGGVFFVGNATAPGDPATTFTLFKALSDAVNKDIQEKVIYDPLSNAFVVRATKLTINRLKKIIKKVDKEPQQVFIDVKFVKTQARGLIEKGLRLTDPAGSTDGVTVRQVFDNTINVPGVVSQAGEGFNPLPATMRGVFPFELGDQDTFTKRFRIPTVLDFSQTLAILRLVKSYENTRIMQAPSIMTVNHQEATIFVGENIPYAEQQATVDPNGNPPTVTLSQGQGSPVSVGFHLFITPHVIPDTDKIMLTIIPKFNFLSGPQNGFRVFTVGAQGSSITLPQTQEQIVVTNLLLSDGKTAVIGGLLSETKTEHVSKVPLLSSIPILGSLFTYKSYDTRTENLMIFITPTIIRNTEQLTVVSRRKIIDFAKLEYFTAKKEGRASDGVFHEAPVIRNSFDGMLSGMYKDEETYNKMAKEEYEKVLKKVQEALNKNNFVGARDAVESYPETYRITTPYGKMLQKEIDRINQAEKAFLIKKAKEAEKEEE